MSLKLLIPYLKHHFWAYNLSSDAKKSSDMFNSWQIKMKNIHNIIQYTLYHAYKQCLLKWPFPLSSVFDGKPEKKKTKNRPVPRPSPRAEKIDRRQGLCGHFFHSQCLKKKRSVLQYTYINHQ